MNRGVKKGNERKTTGWWRNNPKPFRPWSTTGFGLRRRWVNCTEMQLPEKHSTERSEKSKNEKLRILIRPQRLNASAPAKSRPKQLTSNRVRGQQNDLTGSGSPVLIGTVSGRWLRLCAKRWRRWQPGLTTIRSGGRAARWCPGCGTPRRDARGSWPRFPRSPPAPRHR